MQRRRGRGEPHMAPLRSPRKLVHNETAGRVSLSCVLGTRVVAPFDHRARVVPNMCVVVSNALAHARLRRPVVLEVGTIVTISTIITQSGLIVSEL